MACTLLHLPRGHFHHVVDDALEALDVVGHHLHQLPLTRVGGVFGQQRVGLRDGRQRVADLVRDAGRHAAHRGQLFLPAARLHVAHVLEEQHAELLARLRLARWRVKRMRTRKRAVSNPARTPASRRGRPRASSASTKALLDGAAPAPVQASTPRSWNGAGRHMPLGASSRRAAGLAARTRPRRSTTSTPSCISSITRRFSCACWRAISMLPRAVISSRARRPASSPASTVMTKKPLPASACLRHQLRHAAAAQRRQPGGAQQHQGDRGRRGQRHRARRQHAGHQHRQHQQRDVVEAGTRGQHVQRTEGHQVDADGGQPRTAEHTHQRLRFDGLFAWQQPQAQRQRAVGLAHWDFKRLIELHYNKNIFTFNSQIKTRKPQLIVK